MTFKQIAQRIARIRKGLRWIDDIVATDWRTKKTYITRRQAKVVRNVIDLLQALNWQFAFSEHKQLVYADTKPLDVHKCGTPVKIRSCKPGHGDKTYFGILLGDMALTIQHRCDKTTITASHAFYNPAIYVPELKDVVYGCESFWGVISDEAEMKKLITDKTISEVWYMKLLAGKPAGK